MSHNTIDGALLKEMIISGANLLEQNRELVDTLNVFPVPDGDTGTNMSLTMRSTVSEIEAKDEHDASRMLAMAAKGALKGARGNSGVILSQILRGFSRGIEGSEEINADTFVKGLRRGADTAYKAVMKPKEGTILTVIRVIAEDAERYIKKHPGDLDALLGKVVRSGEAILKKTPDMLPALKEAGVVDSGGQGLVFIFRGWLAAFRGEHIELAPEPEAQEEAAEEAELKYRYRTEFVILSLREGVTEDDLNRYRTRLSRIGEGVSLEGLDGDHAPIRVRVQTNDPGKAIQYACDMGEIKDLTMVNLAEQRREAKRRAEEEARRREEEAKEAARLADEAKRQAEEAARNAPVKPYGIVAVSIGEGFSQIFSDLGVDVIVEGGQTMNPSIEDIGGAIEKVHAENVFVLPNNSNVILAATQAADLSEGNVVVLPTKNTAMGIGAVVAFNPEATPEENRETMTAAAEQVKTGQITFAVRDSVFEEKEIHEGDIIGIHNGRIETVGNDVHDVAIDLVKSVVEDGDTLITVYYGEQTEEDVAESLRNEIAELFPDMDVVSQYGGQPLYYYLISAE
ncbi:MAG: DAK2 domain-containing protein [Clostridiales bacterium]|nr:DAK2 domain-containing protein [Clostridiales bacterium]